MLGQYQSVAGSRRRMSGVLWNTTTGRENGLRPGKYCTWMKGGRESEKERGKRQVKRKRKYREKRENEHKKPDGKEDKSIIIFITTESYLIKPAADINILCFQSKCNSSLHVNYNHKSITKTKSTHPW